MKKSEEFAVKRERVERFLAGHDLDGVILGRGDDFAWLGCGADSIVNTAQETGVGALAVQPGRVTLIANNIEAERLMTEELMGLDIAATEVFPWHRPGEREAIIQRLSAGARFAADDGSADLPDLGDDFQRLRYSLTEAEIARYRELGSDAGTAMENAAQTVEKGMTESDVAALVASQCLQEGIAPVVLLVAADERIRNWRHPIVKNTTVRQYVMMVLCGRRRGLVAALSRLVHFGELSDDLRKRHRAVCTVDAAMMLATVPGRPAAEVFAEAQQAYAQSGFPDEWRLHHQGGAVGYQPREYIATPECGETVQPNQAFAWNPSICGTKSEDTILVGQEGFSLLTGPSVHWPVISIEKGGQAIDRADILVK